MSLDIANSNFNRNITLGGTSIAIFTFLLFFLYPKYLTGEDQWNTLPIYPRRNCLGYLLPGPFSYILLRDYLDFEPSKGAGNNHFWKG